MCLINSNYTDSTTKNIKEYIVYIFFLKKKNLLNKDCNN